MMTSSEKHKPKSKLKFILSLGSMITILLCVLAVFAVIATIRFMFSLLGVNTSEAVHEVVQVEKEESMENAVADWLYSFQSGDFASCDSLVINEENKLYNRHVYNHLSDTWHYDKSLEYLSKSIQDVIITEVSRVGDTTVYNVVLTVRPYLLIDNLSCDYAEFRQSVKSYIDGSLSEDEFSIALDSVYRDMFETGCFRYTEDSAIDLYYDLYEVTYEDGKSVVRGIVNMVKDLLEKTNISANVEFYEANAKSTVESYIKNN